MFPGALKLISDFKVLYKDFQWPFKALVRNDGSTSRIPSESKVVTALFEAEILTILETYTKHNSLCIQYAEHERQYPEATLSGGFLKDELVAVDVKTCRRLTPTTISGFTLGAYTGYFSDPKKKYPWCRHPYAAYHSHVVIGLVYAHNPGLVPTDVVVIINEKWRLASSSSGTGTTNHMGSIKDLRQLLADKPHFGSEHEFESFWRAKAGRK